MRRALAEYVVGGIKTTLPFFREVMNDAEFVAGKLDTGFIERFNRRRAESIKEQSVSEEEDENITRDLAVIAAALAHERRAQEAPRQTGETEVSRWRLSGRLAIHNARDLS
jgi:acetyl-CoA carboxylase biotin carboxylase subunit